MPRGTSPRRLKLMQDVIARKQFDLSIILENVHDAHNIGAVLRTSESVGIQEVFLLYTDENLYAKNLKLGKRTSSGARKWLNVYLTKDLEGCVKIVKEKYKRLIGTRLVEHSEKLYELDLASPCALVFGNEKDGISEELSKHLDANFIIPQVGFVESLNISVACAVSLYEAMRQRLLLGKYEQTYDPGNPDHAQLMDNYIERSQHRSFGKRPNKDLE